MKKMKLAFLAIATLVLLATSTGCGGGGGGGSNDDYVTPVAVSGSSGVSGSGSGSSESGSGSSSTSSGSGSESTNGSGSESGNSGGSGGSTSISVPEGFVLVPGTRFSGTGILHSEVFLAGRMITIPSLLVCDHEVTQAEYKQRCSFHGERPSSTYGDGDNYPAYNVSWYDAINYCNKRSLAENLTPCYTVSGVDFSGDVLIPTQYIPGSPWDAVTCDFNANGYRLPTEAEWEYLARGGNLTNDGQTIYSGSNGPESVAWYKENASDVGESSQDYGTHPVKSKEKNGLNLYDMTGNVYEWCWDWGGTINNNTPSTGVDYNSMVRVGRGGAWNSTRQSCYVFYRGNLPPYYNEGNFLGFRVVRSVSN